MITLDAAIAKLSAHSHIDKEGQDVLAAAITLRDASGRDRSMVLRLMCSTWDVDRREKIEGKWRERPLRTIVSELETAICLAAATWQPPLVGEGGRAGGEHDDVAEHAPATSSTIAPEHDDGSEQRGVAEEGPATVQFCVCKSERKGLWNSYSIEFRTMEQTNIESARIREVRLTTTPVGIEDAPGGKRMKVASSSNEGGVAAGPGVEDEVEGDSLRVEFRVAAQGKSISISATRERGTEHANATEHGTEHANATSLP